MKDQYFGDFGDYQKMSLLQILRHQGFKIVVHWLKTADDSSTDGKHITYLNTPLLWRLYEPEIYDYLKHHISKSIRSLSHIEVSSFCKGIRFSAQNIEEDIGRQKSINDICKQRKADLVFFDPDNGIEVKSTNKRNVHKYVLWGEIVSVYNSGKSVMVYQHFSRSNREVFIQGKIKEIKEKIKAEVYALKVKHSVYLCILQKKHLNMVSKGLKEFTSKWKELGKVIK